MSKELEKYVKENRTFKGHLKTSTLKVNDIIIFAWEDDNVITTKHGRLKEMYKSIYGGSWNELSVEENKTKKLYLVEIKDVIDYKGDIK